MHFTFRSTNHLELIYCIFLFFFRTVTILWYTTICQIHFKDHWQNQNLHKDVKVKITPDKFKWARKTLFKVIVIERPEINLSSTLLRQKVGEFLRTEVGMGVVDHLFLLIDYTKKINKLSCIFMMVCSFTTWSDVST